MEWTCHTWMGEYGTIIHPFLDRDVKIFKKYYNLPQFETSTTDNILIANADYIVYIHDMYCTC